MRQPPFPAGTDAHATCPACGRRLHEYLYAFVDKRRTRRDLTACLLCRSAAMNAADDQQHPRRTDVRGDYKR